MKFLRAVKRVGDKHTDIEIPYSEDEDGSSLPQGWMGDDANPENVDTMSGSITGGTIVADQVETLSSYLAPFTGGFVFDAGGVFPGLCCGSSDPSTGAGFNKDVGSLYLRTNGQAWIKAGVGATAWARLATI